MTYALAHPPRPRAAAGTPIPLELPDWIARRITRRARRPRPPGLREAWRLLSDDPPSFGDDD